MKVILRRDIICNWVDCPKCKSIMEYTNEDVILRINERFLRCEICGEIFKLDA